MTTDEALSRLPDGWALGRDGDDWIVGTLSDDDDDGAAFGWLGCAPTIGEAIKVAVERFEREERENAERRADLARRKAAGLLTPGERAIERVAATSSLITSLLPPLPTFDVGTTATGASLIEVTPHEYRAVEIEWVARSRREVVPRDDPETDHLTGPRD